MIDFLSNSKVIGINDVARLQAVADDPFTTGLYGGSSILAFQVLFEVANGNLSATPEARLAARASAWTPSKVSVLVAIQGN